MDSIFNHVPLVQRCIGASYSPGSATPNHCAHQTCSASKPENSKMRNPEFYLTLYSAITAFITRKSLLIRPKELMFRWSSHVTSTACLSCMQQEVRIPSK
jgi:hypothetical protein